MNCTDSLAAMNGHEVSSADAKLKHSDIVRVCGIDEDSLHE